MMRGATGDPVQYFGELKFLAGMDEQLYRQLAELMTLYPTPGFNPLTAPEPLLRMRMSESSLRAIIAARRSGELDQDRLWQIAGIGADETTCCSRARASVSGLRANTEALLLRRQFVVGVQPIDRQPLASWSRDRFASGIPK